MLVFTLLVNSFLGNVWLLIPWSPPRYPVLIHATPGVSNPIFNDWDLPTAGGISSG